MKLKEIKPGMAIHCTSREQVQYLVSNGLAIANNLNMRLPIWISVLGEKTPYYHGYMPEKHMNGITGKEYYQKEGYECVEFSDLIIPEPELSAEEALKLYKEYCDYHICTKCKIGKLKEENESCKCIVSHHAKEVVEILKEWKAKHEKKEPEIEWFWKSYVVGGSDYKEADTEQEAMEWCEYYAKEHPEVKCTYKRVCRVKAVE